MRAPHDMRERASEVPPMIVLTERLKLRPFRQSDLDAYVDGQLSAARRTAVEAYLASRPDAAARVMADLSLRGQLRQAVAAQAKSPSPASCHSGASGPLVVSVIIRKV